MRSQEGSTAAARSPRREAGKARGDVRARPQDGDVVITRETRPSTRYTIRQLPNKGQLSAPSRDAAVQLARGFARADAVNLWHADGAMLQLLESYRSSKPLGPVTTRRTE
jgi:hypothetical protein